MGAIRELTAEIRALRSTSVTAGGAVDDRLELRRIVHHLVESLEEIEAENAALRAEHDRVAAARQEARAFLAETPDVRADPGPSPVAAADLVALAEENAHLRESLAEARADAQEQRSVLRALDTSRAWKIVSLYWTLARRLGRGRPAPPRRQRH